MKELSVEEKARRYDGAIKRLEDIETGKCQKTFMFTEGLFDYIFPELKESDDERARESLLEYLHTLPNHYTRSGVCVLEWIAWIEKQAQKPKQEWSESDKERIEELVVLIQHSNYTDGVKRKVISWLNSLKDRVQPQSQWKPSDEQMVAFETAIKPFCEAYRFKETPLGTLYNDLKKLKSRNTGLR